VPIAAWASEVCWAHRLMLAIVGDGWAAVRECQTVSATAVDFLVTSCLLVPVSRSVPSREGPCVRSRTIVLPGDGIGSESDYGGPISFSVAAGAR
jgi:hypothetical protein